MRILSIFAAIFFSTCISVIADEVSDEEYRRYYSDHISKMARDAYKRGQVLPDFQILGEGEALSQLAAASAAPLSISWIGHATFLIRIGNIAILTDPVFSSHASPFPPLGPSRHAPPGIRLRDLPRIDAVVLSHSHFDHFDFPSLQRLARRDKRTVVFVPSKFAFLAAQAGFRRIVSHEPGQQTRLGKLKLVSVETGHKTGHNFHGDNHGFAHCWRIDGGRKRVFFCGDTPYGPQFRRMRNRHGKTDIAVLPIGAYAPRRFERRNHVDPKEAVRIARDVGARTMIGGHWGTFGLTPEPVMEPAELLMAIRTPGLRKMVLRIGETYVPNGR